MAILGIILAIFVRSQSFDLRKLRQLQKTVRSKTHMLARRRRKQDFFPDAKLASNESSCTGIETDLEPTEDSFLRRSKRLEEQTQSLD